MTRPAQGRDGQCLVAGATFARLRFSICCGSDLRIHRDMRWRVIALVSLGVNIALAAAWLCYTPGRVARIGAVAFDQSSTNQLRSNIVLRRQLFSWRDVESPDYATYIANLRDIGCPEQTIRDIIIADVNLLYSRRRATEQITTEQQWWRRSEER